MNPPRNTILVGDAVEQLKTLPSASIDTVLTSPPYFNLRNYQVEGQIGLEPHVDLWVDALRSVFREVARVLKPAGSAWLNLGDSYSTHPRFGAPRKSNLLAPERLLLGLLKDGWIVRNKALWQKPNAIPTSVRDRLNTTHEYVFFVVRNPHYYFDLDVIREPHRSHRTVTRRSIPNLTSVIGPLAAKPDGLSRPRPTGVPGHPKGKNPGDVWAINTRGFRGAHFATFPEALARRPIAATCPPGGLVLDPFMGSGTTAVVAEEFGRYWLGIELNKAFASMAWRRIKEARRLRATKAA